MSETDREFAARMHDKHLRCEAMSFEDGNRVFALARRGALTDDLTARVEELESILRAWDDAVRVDVKMQGPQYAGVGYKAGRDAWEKTRAALTQPTEKPNA